MRDRVGPPGPDPAEPASDLADLACAAAPARPGDTGAGDHREGGRLVVRPRRADVDAAAPATGRAGARGTRRAIRRRLQGRGHRGLESSSPPTFAMIGDGDGKAPQRAGASSAPGTWPGADWGMQAASATGSAVVDLCSFKECASGDHVTIPIEMIASKIAHSARNAPAHSTLRYVFPDGSPFQGGCRTTDSRPVRASPRPCLRPRPAAAPLSRMPREPHAPAPHPGTAVPPATVTTIAGCCPSGINAPSLLPNPGAGAALRTPAA